MNTRTVELIGADNFKKIENAKICVVGIGGVGGVVAEILARTGIKNITIIDADTVEKTNLNRQIVALNSTINQNKVDVMEKRIKDINPDCEVTKINEFITENNIENHIKNFDYVVDCIDSVKSKIALICYCKEKEIKIISSMGAGNRTSLPEYTICDIYKTTNDSLARVIRKTLKEKGIKNLDVAICKTPIDKAKTPPSSIMWHPMVCGAVISAFVVNKIIKS